MSQVIPSNSNFAASASICNALSMLLQARQYARDLGRNLWDFAVEIQTLHAIGLQNHDLRWLIFQGYLEHAHELTRLTDQVRTFGPVGTSLFTRRACFVLTDAGERFARNCHRLHEPRSNHGIFGSAADAALPTNGNGSTSLPSWDCDMREFRYLNQLVKQFKLPSPNQEAILMAFEEEHWKRRIDDPLPPQPNCDAKQRLHDTIRSLNRNQKSKLIRFKGDGTGEGVQWEPVSDPTSIVDDE